MNSEKETLNVAIYCPYPLDKVGGVGDFVSQSIPYLQKEGCFIKTIGPAVPKGRVNPVDFTFGKRLIFKNEGSEAEISRVFWDRGQAREILLAAKPDICSIQEPGASVFAAFALMEATKWTKETDPVFIGTFHAQTKWESLKSKAVVGILKTFPYPKRREGIIRFGFARSIFNTVVRNLAGKIAVSEATAFSWNKVNPGDYRIIPNGIDIQGLQGSGEMEEWRKDGKKIILFAGRHDKRKGLEYLVRAYAIIQNTQNIKEGVKLVIIGNGQESEKIKNLVKERGLPDVYFYDFLSRKDLICAYKTADVFASPSLYNEAFGRTLAESLAVGTPVVATKIAGFKEWLEGKPYALLAEPGNPSDLAGALSKMLSLSWTERQRLGDLGREFIRDNFSMEKVAGETVDYFRECLQRRQEEALAKKKRIFLPLGRSFKRFAKMAKYGYRLLR